MVEVKLNGRFYPAAANFNAVAAYLRYVGRDTIDGLMDIARLSASDCTALVAACVNEGLRKGGSDERITPEDVGAAPNSLTEVPDAGAAILRGLSRGASGQAYGNSKEPRPRRRA